MWCGNVASLREVCTLLEELPEMVGWWWNKMDNGGFQRDVEEGTELGLVQPSKAINGSRNTTSATTSEPSTSCKPEVCQAARLRYQPPNLSENPWHRFKTISLIVTIALLIIWIVVYTALSQLKLL